MKRVLIISDRIAPLQGIGSIRWTKIGKYLARRHDCKVDVLTTKKNYNLPAANSIVNQIDPLLEKDLKYFDTRYEADCGALMRLADSYKIRQQNKKKSSNTRIEEKNNSSYKAGFKRAVLGHVKYQVFDEFEAFFIKRTVKKIRDDYDVVISTFSPIWPMLIAEYYKKRHPSVQWIMDFRDPYAYKDRDNRSFFEKKNRFLKKHLSKSDCILRVDTEIHIYGNETQKVFTVRNGYDPEDGKSSSSDSKFVFLFSGNMYGIVRDFRPIFHSIIDLIREEKLNADDISFIYAGRTKHDFEAQVNDVVGMEKLCTIYGEISRDKVMEFQQAASILINGCKDSENERVQWTGKMYEYMMARKPIIISSTGIYSKFLAENLPKCGGYVYEKCKHEETYNGMKQYIVTKYEEWKKTGNVTIDRDEDYVAQFSYPVIADKVWNIIEGNIQ